MQGNTIVPLYDPSISSIYIPASQLIIHSGAPSQGSLSGDPYWAFDAASAENTTTALVLPSYWNTFNIRFRWANAGAGAGDVVWAAVHSQVAVGGNASTASATAAQATATAGTQNIVVETTIASGLVRTASAVLRVRPGRVAADGADTLANDAYLFGVYFDRAS